MKLVIDHADYNEFFKVSNLMKLFNKYKITIHDMNFLNTTPHMFRMGPYYIPEGNKLIIAIFSSDPISHQEIKAKNVIFNTQTFIPVYDAYKDNIIKALEKADIYALSSMRTTQAFNHYRIAKPLKIISPDNSIQLIVTKEALETINTEKDVKEDNINENQETVDVAHTQTV